MKNLLSLIVLMPLSAAYAELRVGQLVQYNDGITVEVTDYQSATDEFRIETKDAAGTLLSGGWTKNRAADGSEIDKCGDSERLHRFVSKNPNDKNCRGYNEAISVDGHTLEACTFTCYEYPDWSRSDLIPMKITTYVKGLIFDFQEAQTTYPA